MEFVIKVIVFPTLIMEKLLGVKILEGSFYVDILSAILQTIYFSGIVLALFSVMD
jgi:hypothetical protein